MVYQNLPGVVETCHEVGCYFSCLFHYRDLIGLPTSIDLLNSMWLNSFNKGLLDSEYNIVNPNGLCNLMGIPLQYIDGHFPPSTPLDPTQYRILCLYRSTNGFHHFVVGNDKDNITFDPIFPYSRTAKAPETIVDSLRLFTITQ